MAQLDEALDLKRRARRRLIGAIALVLFLVIVPPWIMDLEPKPVETTLEVEIPKPEDRPLPAPPADSAAAPAEQTQPSATVSETPEQTASDTAQAEPAPPKAADTPPKAEATPKTPAPPKTEAKAQPEPKQAAKGEAYIVPVATLSTQANVKELQAKLSLAGLESYTEPVKTASGQHTRVRAGPFTSKAEAEKAHARLREMGLKPGNVTTR